MYAQLIVHSVYTILAVHSADVHTVDCGCTRSYLCTVLMYTS